MKLYSDYYNDAYRTWYKSEIKELEAVIKSLRNQKERLQATQEAVNRIYNDLLYKLNKEKS